MNGARAISLLNADIDGRRSSLRLLGGHIEEVGAAPDAADLVVDLRGDRLLPGLINAHDHLSLNDHPRTRFRERHHNISEWIRDIDSRRHSDPVLAACEKVPRNLRLLRGALKNLLCGATTVAHHDPAYASMYTADFPVRVPRNYRWSHSLGIDGDTSVRDACDATPADSPWIIHAGEGVDAAARAEFARLEGLGCIRANTVLVHGVAFEAAHLERLAAAGGALAWCPGSNFFLFGRTADVTPLICARAVMVGSDSRLSGENDLLCELGLAAAHAPSLAARLTDMVTCDAARLLRLDDRGALRRGLLADCIVLPAGMPLHDARRVDLRAVIVGGELRYGDRDYAAAFDSGARMAPVVIDGVSKCLDAALVAALPAQGPQTHWRAA